MDKEEYKEYYTSVYRHSLAHVLANAVMEIFGKDNVQIAIGPQIADGFYYDFLLPRNLTAEDTRSSSAKKTGACRNFHALTRLRCSLTRNSRWN